MRRTSFAEMPCPVARSLDVVGDAWTLLIIREALADARRFDDFAVALGIPRTTLTTRLSGMVQAGVFERRRYQESPPRDEYVLTEKGRGLGSVVVSLLQWGERWGEWPDGTSPVELRDRSSGERLWFDQVDRASGRRLEEIDVERVVRTDPTVTDPTVTGSTVTSDPT